MPACLNLCPYLCHSSGVPAMYPISCMQLHLLTCVLGTLRSPCKVLHYTFYTCLPGRKGEIAFYTHVYAIPFILDATNCSLLCWVVMPPFWVSTRYRLQEVHACLPPPSLWFTCPYYTVYACLWSCCVYLPWSWISLHLYLPLMVVGGGGRKILLQFRYVLHVYGKEGEFWFVAFVLPPPCNLLTPHTHIPTHCSPAFSPLQPDAYLLYAVALDLILYYWLFPMYYYYSICPATTFWPSDLCPSACIQCLPVFYPVLVGGCVYLCIVPYVSASPTLNSRKEGRKVLCYSLPVIVPAPFTLLFVLRLPFLFSFLYYWDSAYLLHTTLTPSAVPCAVPCICPLLLPYLEYICRCACLFSPSHTSCLPASATCLCSSYLPIPFRCLYLHCPLPHFCARYYLPFIAVPT